MKEAWVKFLATVSDKELAWYISAWERSLERYRPGTYSYESVSRALAGAYIVRDKREASNGTA